MDVAEVEVGLEALGVDPNRLLVERLGLDQLVALVVDVRQVDERRHELRVEQHGPPVGRAPPPPGRASSPSSSSAPSRKYLRRQRVIGGGDLLRPLGRKQRHLGRRRRRQRHDARRRALDARGLEVERQLARRGGRQRAQHAAAATRRARAPPPPAGSRGDRRTSTGRRRAGRAPTSPGTAGDRRAAPGTCRAGRAPSSTANAASRGPGRPASRHRSVFGQHPAHVRGHVERARAPVTRIVVRGVRSGENTPPSRSTIVRVSRFESTLSLPTRATCSPPNGRSAEGNVTDRSRHDDAAALDVTERWSGVRGPGSRFRPSTLELDSTDTVPCPDSPCAHVLLAGDIGGTKTLLGLFRNGPDERPRPVVVREYRDARLRQPRRDRRRVLRRRRRRRRSDAVCDRRRRPGDRPRSRGSPTCRGSSTRASWPSGSTTARSRSSTTSRRWPTRSRCSSDDELAVLQEGVAVPTGNAALIAAGTGLGEALLHNVDGRFLPSPSEGGHADFAARTPRELALVEELTRMLRTRRQRTRHLGTGPRQHLPVHARHPGLPQGLPRRSARRRTSATLPAAIATTALAGRCEQCGEALEMFVEAYGAEAGNLALRSAATAGDLHRRRHRAEAPAGARARHVPRGVLRQGAAHRHAPDDARVRDPQSTGGAARRGDPGGRNRRRLLGSQDVGLAGSHGPARL